MEDKDKQAYYKGYNDYKKSDGQASDPITEFFFPGYNPPAGHKEAYDAGRDKTKQENNA